MADKNIIVGLDIGTTKIRVVVGTPNNDYKLEILSVGETPSEGVVQGNITNIGKVVGCIKKAVEEASKAANLNIETVNVNIAGRHIKSNLHHGSITRNPTEEEISAKDVMQLKADIHRIVNEPGDEIVHIVPQTYFVDNQESTKDPVGIAGVRLEGDFQVIKAPKIAINNIRKAVERAKLKIKDLVLSPLAASMSILTQEEKEAGVCLVDLGGGTADIAIFHDNILRYTSVIPFGGNAITEDIRHGCMVMPQQAEALKIKFGKAIEEEGDDTNTLITIPGLRNRLDKEVPLAVLSRVIEARIEEIIHFIHSEIIAAGFQNKLAAGIVITGEGAQLQLIEKLFEYITGYDTRLGYPTEFLVEKETNSNQIGYASCIGLVLAGYKALDYREEGYKALQEYFLKNTAKKEISGFKKFFSTTKHFLIGSEDEKK